MIRQSLFNPRRAPATGLFLFAALATTATACGIRTPLTDGLDDTPVTGNNGDDAGGSYISPPAPFDASPSRPDAEPELEDAGAAIDVALPPADLGDIFLTSGVSEDGGALLKTTAEFYPSVTATGCNVAEVAGCTLETCTLPSALNQLLASAGVIAVTGGAYTLLLEQGAGGLYSNPVVDEDGGEDSGAGSLPPLWHGGEDLFVNASGGDVAPFLTSLVAPTQITMSAPVPASIVRAAPLDLHWSRASAGQVTVDVSAAAGPTSYFLECKLDVASGGGEVPQAALAAIPGGTGAISVSTVSESIVYSGAWRVGTYAQTNAVDPTGVAYSGPVEIE